MHYIFELSAFLATLFCAEYYHWNAADIVWGLWITSLIIGFSRIMHNALLIALEGKKYSLPLGVLGAILFTGFFSLHFGLFHFVHQKFLHLFFPLPGIASGNRDPAIQEVLRVSFFNYWPLILAGFAILFIRSVRAEAPNDRNEAGGTAHKQCTNGSPIRNAIGKNSMSEIYGSVVRMHILILMMGFLHSFASPRLALIVILFLFFFPFEDLLLRFKSKD